MSTSAGRLASLALSIALLEEEVRAHLSRPDLLEGLRRLRERLPHPLLEHPSTSGMSLAMAPSLVRQVRELVSHLPAGAVGADGLKAVQAVEEALGNALRQPLRERLRGLYVIVDPQASRGRPVLQVAEAALRGGARVVQLRDKATPKGDLLPTALRLRELCERHQALLIINDHPDLALASEAHGYHGGQHDLPVAAARAILEPHQLVGRSNALLEEALESQAQGVDYVAVGDVFGSPTKQDTRPAGLQTLREVRQQVSLPLAAIGGINEGNVHLVVQAGADMACVISAVVGADDPEAAARRLVERMEEAKASGEASRG